MKKPKLDFDKKIIVKIDNSLSKYRNEPLFLDKIEKANEVLRTAGIPGN